ncbi:MAG: patatin-like phospholipase family protein [Gammaproteobacteria bacterium]|nr:patatin-like phospholipase family protein [Gammaproteobacteria bacterium]NVK88744.1 patatin-like phospholipase family protein [Gammaproteobacteria bacterium]
MSQNANKTALVLSGGGARAAYQVGVLKAIAEILPFTTHQNPFPIITGTSAGAINATVAAAYAQHFRLGMKRLENVWAEFHCEQIFKTDFWSLWKNTAHWFRFLIGGKQRGAIGLLNNQPLGELLNRVIPYPLIHKAIAQGALDALCVTASSYTSGESISFFQAAANTDIWRRHRRRGHPTQITTEHLLASSAIPMVFPATKVGQHFCGDGSMRFLSPLSPALHLGADKILVVGVDPVYAPPEALSHPEGYPTLAEIGGHVLDSVFIDSLDSDLERLHRINATLDKIPQKIRQKSFHLKSIDTLVIHPSQDLSLIAREHFKAMPKALQFFLRRVGIDGHSGDSVLSYLLFEKPFTRELIKLGYQDAQSKQEEILQFFE